MGDIKNTVLISSLLKFVFCFAISKMVDSEYSMVIYKFVKISIGTVMKNLEMSKFVPDHLKTKKCVKIKFKNYLS